MARKQCPHCKKFISSTAPFCIFCGTQISDNEIEEYIEISDDEEKIIMQEETSTSIEEINQENDKNIRKDKQVIDRLQQSYEMDNEEDSEAFMEEDIRDDEEAFERIMGRQSVGEEDADNKEKNDKNTNKNRFSSALKMREQIKENPGNQIKEKKTQKNPIEKKNEEENKYNPNSDGYYDALIAMIDARIDHITKESVVRTIGLLVGCFVLIIGLIYFVM